MPKPRTIHIALLVLLLLALAAPAASAQYKVQRVGILSSLKNMGMTVVTTSQENPTIFNSYSILVDLDGIILGESNAPGAKMTWCHEEVIRHGSQDDYEYSFYVGGGATAGFVRDHSHLDYHNSGALVALVADAGVMLTFTGHIDVCIDLTAEVGMHLRRDETYMRNYDLSWYANGIRNAWMPQITFLYRF